MFETAHYEREPWYLAAVHFLTAGFVIPFGVSFMYRFVLGLSDLSTLFLPLAVLEAVLGAAAVWFGVEYSALSLRARGLSDKAEIVHLSVVYYIVASVVFAVPTIHASMHAHPWFTAVYAAGYLLSVIVFARRTSEIFFASDAELVQFRADLLQKVV